MRYKIPAWQRSVKAMANMGRRNTINRQYQKKELDKRLEYSADEEVEITAGNSYHLSSLARTYDMPNWVRLLDEGVVIECDGSIEAVIAKGAIKHWYDTLPEDFEGNIDKDHNHSIDLGTFTKDQLKLVELGDGRYGVDVDVKLNTELHAVQDLLLMDNRNGISSEFFAIEKKGLIKASDILDNVKKDYNVPLITELAITGYGVVETPLNANSYSDELLQRAYSATMEGTDMDPELEAKKAAEVAEAEKNAEETEAETATDAVAAEDHPDGVGGMPEDAPATEEPATEDEEKAEETEEETKVEAAVGTDVQQESINECPEGEDKPEGAAEIDGEAVLNELQSKLEAQQRELSAKDARIAELEAQLSETKVAQNAFQTRLAKMLNFATATEPTVEEGKATTPAESEEKKEGDAVVNAYAAAFAELNK